MYNKYPYTDFSQLNLDWFLSEFKQLKEDWETTSGKWDQMQLDFRTLEGTIQTFTTFIENYFENLDVQEEINTKLNQMALDGTLADLLAPLVDDKLPGVVDDKLGAVVTDQLPGVVTDQLPGVVSDQIGDAVAPEVPAAVTDWLKDNVDPVGSAVTIDTSLTIAGSAADAKVVGDIFNEVFDLVDRSVNYGSIVNTAYQGGATGSGMNQGGYSYNVAINTDSNRIRTFDITGATLLLDDLIRVIPGKYKIHVPDGFKYAVQMWGDDRVGKLVYAFSTTDQILTVSDVSYVGFILAYNDNSNISPAEITNLTFDVWNDVKDDVEDLVTDVQVMQQTAETKMTLPITFGIPVNIIKGNDGKYKCDVKPESMFITENSGILTFISPTGNDAADGLTVSTPKKTIEACLAVSDMITIVFAEGTYTAGVNYTAGLVISQPVNFVGTGKVIIDNLTGSPITFADDVYCENIIFKGGDNTVKTLQTSADNTSAFFRCQFVESYLNNGLSVRGGKTFVFECIAYGNAYDGFNYHANDSIKANSLEVDCISYNNGQKDLLAVDGQSSNATTSHDGCPIVRINGHYYACHGGIVADKQCESVNYGCSAGISTITLNTYPDRKSNYWVSEAEMWLYDCISYGSLYDTAKINSGIIHSDIVYPSNYPA